MLSRVLQKIAVNRSHCIDIKAFLPALCNSVLISVIPCGIQNETYRNISSEDLLIIKKKITFPNKSYRERNPGTPYSAPVL